MIFRTAYLKRRVLDGETNIEEYKVQPFKAWEKDRREEQSSPTVGLLSPRRSVTLYSESKVLEGVLADDVVEWNGHDYSVESVYVRPSSRSANSKVFTLTLV